MKKLENLEKIGNISAKKDPDQKCQLQPCLGEWFSGGGGGKSAYNQTQPDISTKQLVKLKITLSKEYSNTVKWSENPSMSYEGTCCPSSFNRSSIGPEVLQ